jgi:hypothetical protein
VVLNLLHRKSSPNIELERPSVPSYKTPFSVTVLSVPIFPSYFSQRNQQLESGCVRVALDSDLLLSRQVCEGP